MFLSPKKATYGACKAHGESIIKRLKEDCAALEEEAKASGVFIEYSLKHTHTLLSRVPYVLPGKDEERVPYEYAMEIWVDFVKNGHILATKDEAGEVRQHSVFATVVDAVMGLFTHKYELVEYEKMLRDSHLTESLREEWESIQTGETFETPFVRDTMCPVIPEGDLTWIATKDALTPGNYVELSPLPYDGSSFGEDSSYMGYHAFLPYRTMLLGVVSPARLLEANTTLTKEETETFLGILENLPETLSFDHFDEAICEMGDALAAYGLPPRMEQLIHRVTIDRKEAFLEETDQLILWLQERVDHAEAVTIIW